MASRPSGRPRSGWRGPLRGLAWISHVPWHTLRVGSLEQWAGLDLQEHRALRSCPWIPGLGSSGLWENIFCPLLVLVVWYR